MKLKLNNDCNYGNSRIKKKKLDWVRKKFGLWTQDKTILTILTVRIQQ